MNFEADSIEGIEGSLERIFSTYNLSVDEAIEQLCSSDKPLEDAIKDFLNHYDFIIDRVSLYHLARRLNNDTDVEGKTLLELLTTKNPFSDFLQDKGLTFSYSDIENCIILFYQGKEVILDDYKDKVTLGTVPRLKDRLGRNTVKDYCFNGFIFANNLKDSTESYYIGLGNGPELIRDLENLLTVDGLTSSFYSQSQYYCYEYIVPIDELFVLSRPNKTVKEKTNLILFDALEIIIDNRKGRRNTTNIKVGYSDRISVPAGYYKKRWLL